MPIERDFPGKGKVTVLKTTPDAVLADFRQAMRLADFQTAPPRITRRCCADPGP